MKRFHKILIFVLTLGVTMVPCSVSWAENLHSLGKKGAEAYNKGEYKKALDYYTKAQLDSPDKPEISYNLGNTQYKNGDFDASLAHYNAALKTDNKSLKQKIRFNMGNAYFRKNEYDKSIKEYEEALRLDPSDDDAKKNIEFVKKMKDQKKQEQKNDKNPDDNDQKTNGKDDDKQKQGSEKRNNKNGGKDENPNSPSQDHDKNKNQNDREGGGSEKDRKDSSTADQGSGPMNDSRENKQGNAVPQNDRNQNEAMLNRLKDSPGKALIPDYRTRKVEKDW